MTAQYLNKRQTGVSLIELMVGLVIGLFATLAIMQTFSFFEGQKRSTSGSADAQTNGAIALMHLKRSLETAGFGLPMPNANVGSNILRCTSEIDIYPVKIERGTGAHGSDKIIVRYSTSGAGAVPIEVISGSNATASPGVQVDNNIGCGSDLEMSNATYKARYKVAGDASTKDNALNQVMVMRGSVCGIAEITEQPTNDTAGEDEPSYIRIDAVPAALGLSITNDDQLACMGGWTSYTYEINDAHELLVNGDPIVSGVVAMRAQYGVSDSLSVNDVPETGWVEAEGGTWGKDSLVAPERNRIKAVRVALVLQNGLKEKNPVTTEAPKAWTDVGTKKLDVDVSYLPDWQQYRYRVVSATVPLRNILWSWEAVK